MTSPLLQISTTPPGGAAGTIQSGNKGSAVGTSDHRDGPVTFSDVLGDTRQVQQHGDDTSHESIANEGRVHEGVIIGHEIHGGVDSQERNRDEWHESFPSHLFQQSPLVVVGPELSASNGALTQIPLTSAQTKGQASSVIQGLGEHHATSGDSHNHQHQLNRLMGSASPAIVNEAGGVAREVPVQGRLVPTLPTTDGLNGEPGAGRQPFLGQGLRAQPLLNENSSPSVEVRSSSLTVSGTTAGDAPHIQRLLSALNGTGTNPKIDGGGLSGSSVLPPSRDELSQSLSRVDGDGKPVGSMGSSHSGETGFGHAGGGLSFGNQTGNGQGQLLDSSPGSPVSTSHGHMAARSGNFDDRVQLLNASVPQRLQIDVQLSEATRVQVDVGVQQRQVYAGVLLDNPLLRTLAFQNVQELENQLGQAEMELEEFDVYADSQQLNEENMRDSMEGDNFSGELANESGSSPFHHTQKDSQDTMNQSTGWHLVA